jgi:Domain of unknown function (DUF4907)
MKQTICCLLILLLAALVASAQSTDASHLKLKKQKAQEPPKRALAPKFDKAAVASIKTANIKKAAKTKFDFFVMKADSGTYGYSIYADGHLYIEQNTMPGMPGHLGFADTASCANVARLAIRKMRVGEMPPTITEAELKKAIKKIN